MLDPYQMTVCDNRIDGFVYYWLSVCFYLAFSPSLSLFSLSRSRAIFIDPQNRSYRLFDTGFVFTSNICG